MTEKKSRIETLAGNEMIIIRSWHLALFVTLISFVTLYVFFWTFQPETLLNSEDFTIGTGSTTGDFVVGNTSSDLDKDNKGFSDRGRQVIFAWSLGLGILVGLFVYFLLIYIN